MRRMITKKRFRVPSSAFRVNPKPETRNPELSLDWLVRIRLSNISLIALVSFVVVGCSLSARPDPSRFFALTPLAELETSAKNPGAAELSLGVGPVRLPGYLDREELVTRLSQNRFDVSQNDRWLEPLEENFTRVLAQNLSALLRTDKIVRYPWPANQRPAYQVEIEVLRFEPDSQQEVQLSARWAVIEVSSKQPLSVKNSRLTRPAKARSSEVLVAAMSEALGDFSREIADALRAIAQKPKP